MIFDSKQQLETYLRRAKSLGCTHVEYKCGERMSRAALTSVKDAYSVVRSLQSEAGQDRVKVKAWDGIKWHRELPEDAKKNLEKLAHIAWHEAHTA